MGKLSGITSKLLRSIIALIAIACSAFGGFLFGNKNNSSNEVIHATTSSPYTVNISQLDLQVVQDASSTFFPMKDLGYDVKGQLAYYGVGDVSINMGEDFVALERALKEKLITPEQLSQIVRTDAANGRCTEKYTSDLGLSSFFYCYPEYEIMLTYDVFETSTGDMQLISEIAVCHRNYHRNNSYDIMRDGNTKPESRFREDWGICFEADTASPDHIALTVVQNDGQQVGELFIFAYSIWTDELGYLEQHADSLEFTPLKINLNGESKFMIDWTEKYGNLPSGSYQLNLYVEDRYDNSKVHPLQKNYTDRQIYEIDFTIP